MESTIPCPAITTPAVATAEPGLHPFSKNIVQLTQAEYIELKWQGNYWKRQHAHLKEQNEALKQKLALADAKIRDLKQRLYGKKSEKGTTKRDTPPGDQGASSRSRGQQKR